MITEPTTEPNPTRQITSPELPEQEETHAILVAGELAGVASRLNTIALQRYLDKGPPRDFRYTDLCRAAITFAKTVRHL